MGKYGYGKNNVQLTDRRNEVMTLLLRGWGYHEITENLSKEFGLSKKTIEKDISYCYAQVSDQFKRKLPRLVEDHISKYEEIHKQALMAYDFKSAIAALQAIEKLLKMHDQPIVNLIENQQNNLNLNLNDMSLDELKALLHKND